MSISLDELSCLFAWTFAATNSGDSGIRDSNNLCEIALRDIFSFEVVFKIHAISVLSLEIVLAAHL